jgi:hypothetical protein
MKRLSLVGVVVLELFLMAGVTFAASDTKNLTVNAVVSARASLTLGASVINFADADPVTVPSVAAAENPVSVTARVRTGSSSTATLTHLAGGDLVSGGNTIAITNVTWTAAGDPGFIAGTMDRITAQTAGSWTGSGNRSGTFSYFFANSWTHAVGSYTAITTYTLTAP